MLRYSIIEPSHNSIINNGLGSSSALNFRFNVNAETGELIAMADILPGLYRFNVSVTDGKFIVLAPVSINVLDIDQVKEFKSY